MAFLCFYFGGLSLQFRCMGLLCFILAEYPCNFVAWPFSVFVWPSIVAISLRTPAGCRNLLKLQVLPRLRVGTCQSYRFRNWSVTEPVNTTSSETDPRRNLLKLHALETLPNHPTDLCRNRPSRTVPTRIRVRTVRDRRFWHRALSDYCCPSCSLAHSRARRPDQEI